MFSDLSLGSSEEPFESITAVLGKDMYLSCIYLGDDPVDSSEWKQQISSKKKKRLAGFINGRPFQRDNFSLPVSLTNLTIQIRVTGVEVEGQYTCEFESLEDTYTGTVIVTVVGKLCQ